MSFCSPIQKTKNIIHCNTCLLGLKPGKNTFFTQALVTVLQITFETSNLFLT